MSGNTHYTAGMGALFVQPKGPGKPMVYLGCHDVGDISEPLGDYTPRFCPDPSGVKKWRTIGEEYSPPSAATVDITEDVTGSLSYLREQKCPIPLYVNLICGGRRDVFSNAEKTYILDVRRITNRTLSNLLMRESDERAEQTFSLSAAPPIFEVRDVTSDTLNEGEDEDLNDIVFCNDESCGGTCGDAADLCETGFAVADAAAAATANVIATTDGGLTWAATATDPFAANEDILSATCFGINKNTTRWLVARGQEAAPTNPAEVAYSDDSGATWTNIDVEAAGTRSANDSGALFALDKRHIWFVTTGGYIFFSEDGGVNWTPQDEGSLTTEDLNAVHFLDNGLDGVAVGDNGVVLRTDDGGETWEAATVITGTPDVYCVKLANGSRWYVGTSNGHIYVTFDGGVTWESQLQVTNGEVNDIDIVNSFVLWAAVDVTTLAVVKGEIYRTRNGGRDWESIPTNVNGGANAIYACDVNNAYFVGVDGAGGLGGAQQVT